MYSRYRLVGWIFLLGLVGLELELEVSNCEVTSTSSIDKSCLLSSNDDYENCFEISLCEGKFF